MPDARVGQTEARPEVTEARPGRFLPVRNGGTLQG